MSLIDTIALFGAVALSAPIALLGVEFIVGGRLLAGLGFLAVAAGLVAGVYFRPSLKSIAGKTVLAAVKGDDGDEEKEAYND